MMIYLALKENKWVKLEFDSKFLILFNTYQKNSENVKEQRKTYNQEI